MDIRIDSEKEKFKFRVCGLLENNGKFLAVRMQENKFFCLPGGHVEIGEDTEQAVLREMKEELGYEVKINKLVAINQNFFTGSKGENFHEIAFYYIVNAKNLADMNPNDYDREEIDKGVLKHLEFRWFDIEELQTLDFRPAFLKETLKQNDLIINITRD